MDSSQAPGSDQDPVQRRVQRTLDGRTILFDGEGFFMHAEKWSRPVAVALAQEAGLENMTDNHWKVIDFLRNYYC